MNVEIGTEATQFPEEEYINGIFVCSAEDKTNLQQHLDVKTNNSRVYLSFETRNEVQYPQPNIYKKCIGSLS
jgi:hypothetical protein